MYKAFWASYPGDKFYINYTFCTSNASFEMTKKYVFEKIQ